MSGQRHGLGTACADFIKKGRGAAEIEMCYAQESQKAGTMLEISVLQAGS